MIHKLLPLRRHQWLVSLTILLTLWLYLCPLEIHLREAHAIGPNKYTKMRGWSWSDSNLLGTSRVLESFTSFLPVSATIWTSVQECRQQNVRRCNEAVGGSHQQQSYFKIFLHMTLLEVAFQMIILTYIRVANADEVTYESLVEFVIILSEIIHIWETF